MVGSGGPVGPDYLCESKDAIFGALQYAIDNKTATVLSVSYGGCEAEEWTTTSQIKWRSLRTVNSQGKPLSRPQGDWEAADCDYTSNPNSPVTSATHGLRGRTCRSLCYRDGRQ